MSVRTKLHFTHIRSAVPTVKQNLETLRRLDRQDVDVLDSVPERSASLGIIPVKPDSSENTGSLRDSISSVLANGRDSLDDRCSLLAARYEA